MDNGNLVFFKAKYFLRTELYTNAAAFTPFINGFQRFHSHHQLKHNIEMENIETDF